MQGGGAEVIRANAASSTEFGITAGLGAAPGFGVGARYGIGGDGAKGTAYNGDTQTISSAASSSKYDKRLNSTQRTAAEVNAEHAARGNAPPYETGTRVVEYTTSDAYVFVRVHNADNPNHPWMMRKEAVDGLSAAQIQNKYSLPAKPSFISEVHVPAGTRMRTGKVETNFQLQGGGGQGAVQYEWLSGRVPESAIRNTKSLE